MFQFNPLSPLNTRHPSFVVRPQPSNHIHCLAFVMDASEKVQPDMLARFKGIRKLAMQLGWLYMMCKILVFLNDILFKKSA